MSVLLRGHLAMSATTTTTMPVRTQSKTATTAGSILLPSRQKPPTQMHPSTSTPADRDAPSRPASAAATPRKNILSEIRWFNLIVVTLGPVLSVYGFCTTKLRKETLVFALIGYVINMFGITAGYHRLWSHRSFKASIPLQYFLAIAGAGSVQGAIRWWARNHRSHHRYTDTDLDPYDARKGFWFTHVGWMIIKHKVTPGRCDVRDLSQNKVVQWQRKYYFPLALAVGLLIPWFIPGYFWGDWRGGFFISGIARISATQHSVFCVNSLAHWLGEAPYDDKHTPRDHVLTAILTLGEGYHNFHHQFPMDYRNAVKWYQYDPTKWGIWALEKFGFASHLQRFPENEIRKGELAMSLKKLKRVQDSISWPTKSDDLPVISWETFKEESRTRPLVLVAGFIHDVSDFLDRHPGGRELLEKSLGTDCTASFFGGVYEHTNAAHNLLSTMRVGALHGGLEHVDPNAVAPGQRLYIAESIVPTR